MIGFALLILNTKNDFHFLPYFFFDKKVSKNQVFIHSLTLHYGQKG